MVGNAGTTKAAVACAGEGDADSACYVAHHRGVGLLPFLGEFLCNAFEDSFRFSCKDSVCGCYEGGKVPALGVAGFEVLPLFLIFFLP